MSIYWAGKALYRIPRWAFEVNVGIMRRTFGRGWRTLSTLLGDAEEFPRMPLLFSQTQCWLSDLKAGEVCQKQAEAVPEKPATSRLFNARKTPKSIAQQAVGQLNGQKREAYSPSRL